MFVGALFVGWRFAAENGGLVRVHFVFGEVSDIALWKALLVTFMLTKNTFNNLI